MVAQFLPGYTDPAVVTVADITMLASLQRRRLGRHWARLHLGAAGVRAMTDYQLAATELAMACNRNSRGRLTPEYFARHRDDSLALMRQALHVIREREYLYPPPWVGDEPSAFVRSAP